MSVKDNNLIKEIISITEMDLLKQKMLTRLMSSIVIIFVMLVFLAWVGKGYVENSTMNKATNEISAKLETVYSLEKNNINFLKNIVFQLSADSELQRYVLDRNDLSKQFLLDKWVKVSEQTEWISQIRFITNSGLEILRVDYDVDKDFSSSADVVQNKKQSDYFNQIAILEKNDIYISDIEFNREYGELSYPLTPVIRIAMPLFTPTGQRSGMLVVNFLANKLIAVLRDILVSSPGDAILLDNQGNIIYRVTDHENWVNTFATPTIKNFAEQSLDIWNSLQGKDAGFVATETEHFLYRTLLLSDRQQPPYILVHQVKQSDLARENASQTSKVYLLFILSFLLLSVCLWVYFKRKLVQEVEHHSLELISALFYSKEAIFITDPAWHISVVNDAFCHVTGYGQKEVQGMTCQALYFFDDEEVLTEMTSALTSTGQWFGEVQSIRKDGSKAINILLASSVKNIHGVVSHYVVHMVDISDRKRMENELKIAAAAFDTRSAISITDANGNIIKVNQAFTDITGYQEQEVVGKNPSILSSGKHDKTFYQQLWQSIINQGSWQGEIYNKHKDGKIFPEWITISSIKDDKGAVIFYVATFEDITERKQLEEQVAKFSS